MPTDEPAGATPVSLTAIRVLLAAAVALTCVLFVPDAADPVNVVKLSALLLCTVAVGALAVTRVVRTRVLQLPVGLVPALAAAVLLALIISTVVAPYTPTAVLGTAGRNSGLLAYASAVLLLLAGLRALPSPSGAGARTVAFGVLAGGVFTAVYGGLQLAGIDAVGWNNPFNPMIAALGNPNFAAAYLGITAPLLAWGGLWTGWARPWRLLSWALLAGVLAVALLSSAVQGPLAAVAGLAVVLVAWLLGRPASLRRAALPATGAVALLGVVVLGLGITGTGPATAFFSGISYRARTWYWEGALTMFGQSPFWGVGLDSYGIRWPQTRPVEVPRELGGDHFSDAAHNVLLQMFAQGGVLLGGSYLALVVAVAVVLVRGLRRTSGQERLLLGGLGGAWTAYQVQSLVSIDQVPLLTVHFVLSAAVVAAAGAVRLREVRLPGAPPTTPPAARPGRRAVALPTSREPSGLDHALVGVVVLLALGLGWQALDPTRASRAAFTGDEAVARGDGDTALAAYGKAIALAPRDTSYLTREANLFNAAGQPEKALEEYQVAVAKNPFDIAALRTAGRLADSQGQTDAAAGYFRRAAALDPTNSATLLDLTQFQLRHGGAEAARATLERAVQDLPGDAGLWATLGDARAVTGDPAGARAAYDRALAITPGEPTATAGLAKLDAA